MCFNPDINECNLNTDNCEQTCSNTLGGFNCGCNDGYQLDSNRRTCTDIDECRSNNGGCDHQCTNTMGSFQCSCRAGFNLQSDGTTCTRKYTLALPSCTGLSCLIKMYFFCAAVNQCEEGTHNCAHICINDGSSFTCTCRSGYMLASDGRSCNGEALYMHVYTMHILYMFSSFHRY